jgi:hypothetical protein
MVTTETSISKTIPRIVKIIFSFCAFYFFLMGASLIFLPGFLIRGVAETIINPTIIGMLRGAGGSIIPYSLLYIFIALDPYKKLWALYVILVANISAIILDLGSVIIGEYNFINAMIDIPIELISIIGILLIFWTNRKIKNTTNT